MTKTDNVASYLNHITQVCDELGDFGEKVDDAKLVRVVLNGFSQPWHEFVGAIVNCHQREDVIMVQNLGELHIG